MRLSTWGGRLGAALVLCCGTMGLLGQQPTPGKPPVLPPINPANAKLEATIEGLDGPGFSITANMAGDLILAGCDRDSIQAFRKDALDAAFKKGPVKADLWKAHQGAVRCLAWHGGPVMASVGSDKKVNFWKMPEGKVQATGPCEFQPRAATMSSDGKWLAVAGESDVVQLWDVAAGKPGPKLTDKGDWILCLAFSADSKQLLSGSLDGVVKLWDVAGAKKLADLPAKPNPPPKTPVDPVAATSVAFALDGKSFFLGTADGPIHVVTFADGKIVRTHTGHTGPVTSIVMHPAGAVMATASKDRTILLWNPANPAPLKKLEGHNAWIEGLAWMSEGTRLASVSADQTVRIWEMAEPTKKK